MLLSAFKNNIQNVTRGSTLALDSTILGDAPILAVVSNMLEGQDLQLGNVQLNIKTDEVVIRGEAAILGFEQIILIATFWESDGQVETSVYIDIPQGWRFSDSFGEVAPSLNYGSANSGYGSSLLDTISIRSANFTIASAPNTDAENPVEQGLNFKAEIALSGSLEPLAALADGAGITLEGKIPLGDADGDFELKASFPLSLGDARLGFEAPYVSVKSSLTPGSGRSTTELELGFVLKLGETEAELYIPFKYGGKNSFLSLNLRSENGLALPGLGDAAEALGGADIEGSLPPSLSSLGKMTLDQLIIGFDVTQRKIAHVQLAIRSSESWVIVDDTLELKSLYLYWLVTDPFSPSTRYMEAEIEGLIGIGDIELEAAAIFPEFTLSAGLADGSAITLANVVESLTGQKPSFDGEALQLSALNLDAQPKERIFHVDGLMQSNWVIQLGASSSITFKELQFAFDYIPPNKAVLLKGTLELFGTDWIGEALLPEGETAWQLTASQGDAPLALSRVVSEMGGGATLDRGLDGISLSELYFSINTGSTKAYQFSGAFDWDLKLGTTDTISVHASLDLQSHKPANGNRKYSGTVTGLLDLSELDSAFFEFFTIEAAYTFAESSNSLALTVVVDEVTINGTIESESSTGTTIKFDFGDTTLGDVLNLFVGMADPNRGELSLDPPWNALEKASLAGLEVSVFLPKKNTSNKPSVTVSYDLGSNGINLGFMSIDSIGLVYERVSGKSAIMLELVGSFLGKSTGSGANNPTRWDALNGDAPEVPGGGSGLLAVNYLGMGQRVSLKSDNVAQLENIGGAMEAFIKTIDETDDQKPWDGLVFNAESGLLLGVDMSVLKGFISLQLIFNDPLIYGLRIALAGKQAKKLAGLEFEILYRRISDTVGVYHIELVLPDIMRQMEFGAVSLTLPEIILDIYTNGDFKIDFGFPWKSNFARSFHIQVFPFLGAGGFYFNKLSAETATSTPVISQEIGIFNPVLEFGIGLKIGLGKSFNKGPLKAEISITVQGIIEGVISWFNPAPTHPTTDRVTYYMIQGMVAIEARVYGAVDFAVIKVEVEVLARAEVRFRIEVYKKALLKMTARVSVKASVKVLFVKVKFSFSLTIKQEFTLGEDSVAPWQISASGRRELRPAQARAIRGTWSPAAVFDTKPTLTLYFEPALTGSAEQARLVGLFFIENTIPLANDDPNNVGNGANGTDSDFDELMQGLLAWALLEGGSLNDGTSAVDLALLEGIHAQLSGDVLPFDFAKLTDWLAANFNIEITDLQREAKEKSGTAFPVFPQLTMKVGGTTVDFDATSRTLSKADRDRFNDYFAEMRVEIDREATVSANNSDTSAFTTATYVFVDYFAMLMRTAIQQGIDHIKENPGAYTVESIVTQLNKDGSFNHLASMASRFMLHGLRLPKTNSNLIPLYQYTGQQVNVSAAPAITLSKPATLTGVSMLDEVSTTVAGVTITSLQPGNSLKYSLPASQGALITKLKETKTLSIASTFDSFEDYQMVPERFVLQQRMDWMEMTSAVNTNFTIAPFSGAILDLLQEKNNIPSLNPFFQQNETAIPNTRWGTKLPIAIRRRVDGNGDYLPNTYELIGTDERSKDILEEVWRSGDSLSLRILVPDTEAKTQTDANGNVEAANRGVLQVLDGKVNSEIITSCSIYKSNLSTETKSAATSLEGRRNIQARRAVTPDPYQANITERERFTRILWEGCTVGGDGFFIQYEDQNGDGLPDEVFNQGDSGSISLLAISSGALRSFHTCLILNGLFSQQEWEEKMAHLKSNRKHAVLVTPPGHLGIRITRTAPTGTADTAAKLLDNMYQLLAIQVEGLGVTTHANSAFKPGKEGLPMGPAHEEDKDGTWVYERMIPLYRFARNTINTGHAVLTGAKSPYAGISDSSKVNIGLEWRDIFGNDFGKGAFSKQYNIRYKDPLIGFHQWPALGMEYTFEAGPKVVINFNFETQSYTQANSTEPGQPAPNERAKNDRDRYRTIFYQLAQPDVNILVESSLENGHSYSLKDAEKKRLLTFAGAAFNYLDAVAKGATTLPAAPSMNPLKVSVKRNAYPASMVFPISTSMYIKRTSSLDTAAVQKDPFVAEIGSSVGPDATSQEIPNSNSTISGLTTIAQAIEQIFPGLKAAVSQERLNNRSEADAAEGDGLLWAVNLGPQGASFKVNLNPAYFALPPIAQDLFSGEVKMKNYDPTRGLDAAANTPVSVSGLDLNLIVKDMLSEIEAVISPQRMPAAYAVDKAATRSLMDQKLALANTIAETITPILHEDRNANPTQIERASEALRQRLLHNLIEGYEQETVVQYPVKIKVPASWKGVTGWNYRTAPRLAGSIRIEEASNADGVIDLESLDFQFSPAKLSFQQSPDDQAYLTFVLNTASPEKYEGMNLKLKFVANEFEYEIKDVKEGALDSKTLYQASTWFSFIIPDTLPEASLGNSAVPIPLRNYPAPPSLLFHGAKADPDSQTTIESIREWQYVFVYEHPIVAQDSIDVSVDYNILNLPEAAANPTPGADKLHESLLQFAHVFPALKAELNVLEGSKPAEVAGDAKLKIAIETLSSLAATIAADWKAWNPTQLTASNRLLDLDLRIEENLVAGEFNTITVKGKGVLPSDGKLPEIAMDGYDETSKNVKQIGTTNTFSVDYSLERNSDPIETQQGASDIPDRTLRVLNLDVIREQNAWAAVQLSRNTSLVSGKLTHPAFIFRTPPIRAVDFAVPMLINERFLNIAKMPNVDDPDQQAIERPLVEHLKTLLKTVLPANTPRDFDIRMEARYSYAVASGSDKERLDDDLIVELPIALGLQISIKKNDVILDKSKELLTDLVKALDGWITKNNPSQSNAQYMFKLSIFSRLDAPDMSLHIPLLRMEHLFLPLENILASGE
ncbi:MAG: hypothetical protein AB8F95_06055 [Bacteroidia bacterium]